MRRGTARCVFTALARAPKAPTNLRWPRSSWGVCGGGDGARSPCCVSALSLRPPALTIAHQCARVTLHSLVPRGVLRLVWDLEPAIVVHHGEAGHERPRQQVGGRDLVAQEVWPPAARIRCRHGCDGGEQILLGGGGGVRLLRSQQRVKRRLELGSNDLRGRGRVERRLSASAPPRVDAPAPVGALPADAPGRGRWRCGQPGRASAPSASRATLSPLLRRRRIVRRRRPRWEPTRRAQSRRR